MIQALIQAASGMTKWSLNPARHAIARLLQENPAVSDCLASLGDVMVLADYPGGGALLPLADGRSAGLAIVAPSPSWSDKTHYAHQLQSSFPASVLGKHPPGRPTLRITRCLSVGMRDPNQLGCAPIAPETAGDSGRNG
jgi:hypothetical protein